MDGLQLHILNITLPVEFVAIEQYTEGKLRVNILVSGKLDRGASCILRNGQGAELQCVISNVLPTPVCFSTELRCLENPAFHVEG